VADSRIDPGAAEVIRQAIEETGGMEVFAVGHVRDGRVVRAEVVCRGQPDRVTALLDRASHGGVVIHNHPSGVLMPSDADMRLASMFGEDGVGFVIVDSPVQRANWVVEPPSRKRVDLDEDAVAAIFEEVLPSRFPGLQVRPRQVEMARHVARCLNAGGPLLVEAGTGTGKSLAYLVPAAMWAAANEDRVVISTHTRALQMQLLRSDLPALERAGLEARTAVLLGRGNYLCRRRLDLAVDDQDQLPDAERQAFSDLRAWAESTQTGTRAELAFPMPPELWDRVASDSDLTLSVRCPHYDRCCYYNARRNAAAASVVVVNHALLLADLSLRAEAGRGVLPAYSRLVLDEAHHLEEVATGAGTRRVTGEAVVRAVRPMLPRKKRIGALSRLSKHVGSERSIPEDVADKVSSRAARCAAELDMAATVARQVMLDIAGDLDPKAPAVRITPDVEQTPLWRTTVAPTTKHLATVLETAVGGLEALEDLLEGYRLAPAKMQPMLDIARARRRLGTHATDLRAFLDLGDDPDRCRWVEAIRRRNREPSAAVCVAPIDLAATLDALLWSAVDATVCTSATLTVGQSFAFFQTRTGCLEPETAMIPSPFDHFQQCLLGLPRDLPPPNDPAFLDASARVVVEAVRASGGGAFVLCTSYKAVDAYGRALRQALPSHVPVLTQGTTARTTLLERFRDHANAVLVGTDSFWEGVSVKGRALRLVIIPRLPFRVPTDPLHQARHERILRRGNDPFRAYSLPEAALKLRQGFGRLIRSRDDRGVVLILDRRLHERSYGRVLLASLPPARRLSAPWRRVRDEVEGFFRRP
jgi:ATP-dependent DNA helicase DinG